MHTLPFPAHLFYALCRRPPTLQTSIPINLAAGTTHTLFLMFSIGDPHYHVNSFQQLDLTFVPI